MKSVSSSTIADGVVHLASAENVLKASSFRGNVLSVSDLESAATQGIATHAICC
jgi:hypothetical protein